MTPQAPRLLPLLILVALALPLIAAELPVGPPAYQEASGQQSSPSVASDGDGYFAVWYDPRSGSPAIVGTRLTANGEVLDGTGILIARNASVASRTVVWSGTSYVVLWNDGQTVFAVRVTRDGRVEGPPRVIAANAQTRMESAVASNGSRIVVTYMSLGAGTPDIRAAILDSDANVVADILLADSSVNRSIPAVAASRDQFLVVWERLTVWPPAIEGVRLGSSGVPIDASPREVGSGEAPVLASDGRDFVLISYQAPDRYVSRKIAAELTPAFPEHVIDSAVQYPEVVWTGTQYAVYATNGASPIRFSIDGEGRPSAAVIENRKSGRTVGLDNATNGSNLLTVWSDQPGEWNTVGIFGRITALSGAPEPGPVRVLSLSANEQKSAVIAHGVAVDLVAWRDEVGVCAARLDVSGRSLDGAGILLGASAYPGPPAVVFDGEQFVVAWDQGPYAQPVSGSVRFISPADGLLPDALSIEGMVSRPSLVRAGDGSILAWNDRATVYAARISGGTRALEGSPIVVAHPAVQGERIAQLAGAWNGSELLLAWREYVDGSFGTHIGQQLFQRIRGARINASLTLLDTEPRLLGDVEGDGDTDPALATDGSEWLLVWRFQNDLRARRIAHDGTPQGPAEGAVLEHDGFAHDLLWDGTRYVLAWKRPGISTTDPAEPREVRFAYLPRGGALVLSDATTVSPTYDGDTISLAPLVPGRFAMVYTRVAYEPEYGGVPRAFVQTFGPIGRRRSAR
jgi:hypothetical protein